MSADAIDELPPLEIGDRRRHAARYHYVATPQPRRLTERQREQIAEFRRLTEGKGGGKPPPAPALGVSAPVSSFVVDPEAEGIGDGWGRYDSEAAALVGITKMEREEW